MKSLYVVLLFSIFCISNKSMAKPRTVFLDKELKEAIYFDYVEVIDYTDTSLLFREVEGHDGFYSPAWLRTQNFTLNARHQAVVLSAKTHSGQGFNKGFDKFTTGYWPQKGEKVLIVINKENRVSLFARKIADKYRFWSPFVTGSIALFYYKAPALKLKDHHGLSDNSGDYRSCWDGCLLPVKKLLTYARQSTTSAFKGRAQMQKGQALFIPEFADSESFFLKGLKKWEKNYLNKTLTVEGILVQFVEGKSMILDWKIIEIE